MSLRAARGVYHRNESMAGPRPETVARMVSCVVRMRPGGALIVLVLHAPNRIF